MPLFTSTYTNRVDKKGRVSVPASFRATLPEGDQTITVLRSLNGAAIEGFDAGYLQDISEKVDNFDLLTSALPKQNPAMKILRKSAPLNIDSDGRVVLPQDYMAHAGITDRAVFVGLGRTFQIWSPEEHDRAMGEEEED
ncbi:division/cell wall cluster transcriptional repressor MraZ [Paremcibacter congregatus]|uniref:Transcriptional regulator MraZ n=1 Tax=Paremcibacter congregatus TaxID=2043170 RepID=A0A2G4YTL7_9PROT|nr:division/cell wall cluster transcriptional repressor MraZ [Paremcibacter congregatus]PHZ85590.1 division/cell wall cluster transcriptional repressor MraZ [Paremcibacter congregatus]QDE29161.1 division/cell wall cluster transcriptional repressor MraZ [Paremcibacter congregatus]|tara:strand:- start:315 stop:731 length:417 start_codon:yes stop_codon:yes gene_type:complete